MIAQRDWLDPAPNALYPFMVGGFMPAVANNDDRNARGPHDRGSDGAQVHPGVPAAATASQDYELGILGLVDQPAVRDVTDQSPVHVYVWVAFLPAGQSFTQQLCAFVAVGSPVHAEDGKDPHVAPSLQCQQWYTSPRGFVEG